jgi:hypothetical protein
MLGALHGKLICAGGMTNAVYTKLYARIEGVRVLVFKATFNNISIISWRSVLFVEETGVPG